MEAMSTENALESTSAPTQDYSFLTIVHVDITIRYKLFNMLLDRLLINPPKSDMFNNIVSKIPGAMKHRINNCL